MSNHEKRERHDPFSPLLPVLTLFLLIVLWVLNDRGFIKSYVASFAIGLGAALILERLLRYPFPDYRRPMANYIIIGIALISGGIIDIRNWGPWWAVIIIAAVAFVVVHSRDQRQV